MRILGIDPGLQCCGYAILECGRHGEQLLEAGTIRTSAAAAIERRLDQIAIDLGAIIDSFSPALVAVEDLYSHYAHPRTAILMGHARGVILQTAARAGIAVKSFSATRIKKSLTGNGRAKKYQVQRTVQALLKLPQLPEPADVADAVAVAMCCAHTRTGDWGGRRLAEVCR